MIRKTIVKTEEKNLDDAMAQLRFVCKIYDEVTRTNELSQIPCTKKLLVHGIEESLDDIYELLGMERKNHE